MQVFVFDLHGSSQCIDCFRPSEIFSDGLNFSFAKSGCRCRRVGCVFVGKKHLTVEVTVNLGYVEVVHSVGMEQLFVRRCRMIPKFCQGILVSNAGNIIIGTAENLNWHIVNQAGQAAGAVDGNHAEAVAQENGQGDIMDVSDTAFEFGVFFDKAFDVARVVDKAAVHRMMLDDEVGIGRRVRGKGGQNMEQEAADAGKVTMDADLAVVEYLQGNNKKFAVFARLHAFGDLDVFNIVVQTLEDGDRPQFEVMAGIGCAVVDVVRILVRVAEQFDIVTDGVFGHRHKPAAYRCRRFVFLLGQLGELFQKKVGTAR